MARDRQPPSSCRTIASRQQTAASMRPARQSMASTRKYSKVRRRSRPCCTRSNRRASFASFHLPDAWRIDGKMREIGVPVLRDLQPRRYPDPLMIHDVVEKPHQRRRAPGTSDDAAVQAHRHHLGRGLAFGVKNVKTVLHIRAKLVAAAEPLRVDKAHVVGIEAVGNNQ